MGVGSLELQPQARARGIRDEGATVRFERPLEEHVLDAGVVVEVLQVPQGNDGAAGVGVNRGCRMRREIHPAGLAEGGHLQEPRNPRASRSVGLEHVHRLKHPAEVVEVVTVLAGGNLHARGGVISDQTQPFEIVGGDRLLEPNHAEVRELFGEAQRLLAGVGAVGVHEQLRLTDGLAGSADTRKVVFRVGTYLHLDPRDALFDPSRELLLQPLDGVGGESAAAVDRHRVMSGVEQPEEREAEQLRLEVPEGRIHGGYRHRGDARASQVADGVHHRRPRGGDGEGIAPLDDAGELAGDQGGHRRVAVGVADPRLAAARGLDEHYRRRGPREGAVRLRGIGRHGVRRDLDPLYGRVEHRHRYRSRCSVCPTLANSSAATALALLSITGHSAGSRFASDSIMPLASS